MIPSKITKWKVDICRKKLLLYKQKVDGEKSTLWIPKKAT